jgi:hypothetical protein
MGFGNGSQGAPGPDRDRFSLRYRSNGRRSKNKHGRLPARFRKEINGRTTKPRKAWAPAQT